MYRCEQCFKGREHLLKQRINEEDDSVLEINPLACQECRPCLQLQNSLFENTDKSFHLSTPAHCLRTFQVYWRLLATNRFQQYNLLHIH